MDKIMITDQTGEKLEFENSPKRIISLVPSQTELLFDLKLDKEVIGITKFCIHPVEWFKSKTRVGGTKNINMDKIRELQPDLIIANKEENEKEQVEELKKYFQVYTSDIKDLPDALEMIQTIGHLTGRDTEATSITRRISEGFNQMVKGRGVKALYFIWKDPWMSIGGDTFISDLMERTGIHNVLAGRKRYPNINLKEIEKLNPEAILLSSEPYPFSEKHVEALNKQFPNIPVYLVDGEMFSWYGSRLLKAPDYFKRLLIQLELNRENRLNLFQ